MLPAAVMVVVQLPMEVTGIEPREPGDQPPVTLSFQAMARRARIRRTAIPPAECDHLATCAERGIAALRAAAGQALGKQ